MVTTKKKRARAVTRAEVDRLGAAMASHTEMICAQEAWQSGERARGDHFAERITALEKRLGTANPALSSLLGLDNVPDPSSEEARLERAVVDAAMERHTSPSGEAKHEAALTWACNDLRAHRAKKVGP